MTIRINSIEEIHQNTFCSEHGHQKGGIGNIKCPICNQFLVQGPKKNGEEKAKKEQTIIPE